MLKRTKYLPVVLALMVAGLSPGAFAADAQAQSSKAAVSDSVHLVGATADSADVTAIMDIINNLMAASNKHDIDGVLRDYSPAFVSGDNMSLDQVKKLIQETWGVFPDIKYTTQTLEIRVSGDWATVESIDSSTATAKVDPVMGGDAGQLESRSRGLLYLHRIGKVWEINSDYTLYERALITYGNLNNIKLDLSTPEQVFAGETYSARVSLDVPDGVLAIATISKEPLVYPQVKPADKFRSLSSDRNTLERIFTANHNNTNEVVTATVGFTQVAQDSEDRPSVQLNGVATIVKRVNIIPKSTYKPETGDDLIHESANGTVDLSKDKDKAKDNQSSDDDGSSDDQ